MLRLVEIEVLEEDYSCEWACPLFATPKKKKQQE
jgi:hypothetical protein